MPWTILVLFLYGAFNIVLGLLGFFRAHSVASLLAGGIAGILIIGATSLARTNPKVGFGIAVVLALLLAGRFMGPLMSKHQLYPAGIMVATSVVAIATGIVGLMSKG